MLVQNAEKDGLVSYFGLTHTQRLNVKPVCSLKHLIFLLIFQEIIPLPNRKKGKIMSIIHKSNGHMEIVGNPFPVALVISPAILETDDELRHRAKTELSKYNGEYVYQICRKCGTVKVGDIDTFTENAQIVDTCDVCVNKEIK